MSDAFVDDVMNGLGLDPAYNLSFLSGKLVEVSESGTMPALDKCRIIMALLNNNLETYQITRDAGTDKLTGALNRKYLDMHLDKAFARAKKTGDCLSVVIGDLDFFKQVNDTYGHLKGDEVLRETARIISETIHGYGTLGRYGGEEFMVVLPGSAEGQTGVLSERIRAAIQNADILKGKRDITLSIGAAVFPRHANTAGAIAGKADKALYIAKKTGRNRTVMWNEDFENEALEKDATLEMLTGDAARDAARVKALLELTEIANGTDIKERKADRAFDKIMDTVGVESITVFNVKGSKIIGARASSRPGRTRVYNYGLVREVIKTGRPVFQVDWDNEIRDDEGAADWNSLAVVPVVWNGVMTGVAYLSVSVKLKEILPDEAGFICHASTLLGGVLCN